jgi:hypothetical protein
MAEWSKKSVWKKTSFVRDYYMKAYKSDELGKEINPKLTFSQAFNGMKKGKDIYDLMDVGDSIVRERVFCALAEMYADGDYNEIYNLWLHGADNKSVRANCNGKGTPKVIVGKDGTKKTVYVMN